jgi:predicted metal-dependent peptidase
MQQVQNKRSVAVSTAISALLVRQPFFASLLLDLMEVVETDTIPTTGENLKVLATNGHTLWINPEAFGKFTIDEQIGLLAHEVMHVILQHAKRQHAYELLGVGPDMNRFSKKKFAHATDYIINAYLTAQGFKLPLGSLQNSQVGADDIVDEVYLKLPDDEEDKPDGPDQHEPADAEAQEQQKCTVQAAVKKAQEVAKMQGKGTGGLQRLIDDICEPQIPWHEYLRKAITTATRGRDLYTWARPNRRKLAVPPHVYWPGRSGLKGPVIAVEIDTSGSIGDDQLKTFLGELSGILTDLQPEMVHVAYVDDELHGDVIEIDDVNDLNALGQKAGGGGGTDMTKIFEIIEEKQIPAETVVILTDGHTPFGEDTGIPTIWCMTTEVEAPWGTTVHVKVGERLS